MEKINLFFLHGFLGRPADWNAMTSFLPQDQNIRIFTPDYFNILSLSPKVSFKVWADNFKQWVKDQGCASDHNILIGYSLGGRLALHALENDPGFWNKVFCVSTNPGFDDSFDSFDPRSEERSKRWMQDSYWAEEFMQRPWSMVLHGWNSQPVFGEKANEPVRIEQEYSRELLGLALTQWSLANQKNMRPIIKNNHQKLVWVVGEEDQKFLQIVSALKQEVLDLKLETIPAAAHRVLFDNPRALASVLDLI